MASEIGCRNLADTYRYNKLEVVAKGMGLDTHSHTSLWMDRAVIELNIAVLHSFQVRFIGSQFTKEFRPPLKTLVAL